MYAEGKPIFCKIFHLQISSCLFFLHPYHHQHVATYFHQYLFLLLTIFFDLASPSALTDYYVIAADLKPFASNETLSGIIDGFHQRNPVFKQNLLRGFALAQQIVSSKPLRTLEIRNRPREGATTNLDEFIFIKLNFIGYLGQAADCNTLSGD